MLHKRGNGSRAHRSLKKRGWKVTVAALLVTASAFHSVWADPTTAGETTAAQDGTTTTTATTQETPQETTQQTTPPNDFGNTGEVGQQVLTLPTLDQVQCTSYYCYDRTTGEVILAKNEDKQIYPASMTKILTLALAMEYLDPHEVVTVSKTAMNATTPNSTMMGLETGEEIEVNELYFGLMLPSGNDAANVLAEEIAKHRAAANPLPTLTPTVGDDGKVTNPPTLSLIAQFARIANEKIAQLGLTNSHFVNPNGLQNESHYTTAKELAMMFDYALQFEDFRTVIHTPTHFFKADNKHPFDGWKVVKNTNNLMTDPWILGEDTHCIEVFGGKTGTTKTAGTGMTVLTINENGHEIITSVCGIPYSMSDHQTVYVAAVVNAAHEICWNSDPVTRVKGNIMDYRTYNAPKGQEATGDKSLIHIGTPTPIPTVAPDEPTPTAAPAATPVPLEEKTLFEEHPALVIVLIVLAVIVFGLVIITFTSAMRVRKRRKKMGIRKIL
ncbi:MAG: D-alanyl-D-alanine carboxypeptidase [Clostridiales bacterium]|nr:D-alanyl-D-alanine carboxypeptidase [Clostridiales bacterium]